MICEKQARKYCCEDISLIENYEAAVADTTQMWDCHHRLEVQDGVLIFTPQELKDIGRYKNVPASELIFLTHSEHTRLHKTDRHHSAETIEKMREARKQYWVKKKALYEADLPNFI